MSARFFYVTGCKTPERAREKLEDCYADGTISDGDRPVIKPYTGKDGKRYWGVEVNG